MAKRKQAGRDLEIKSNVPQLGELPPLVQPPGLPEPGFTRYIVTRSVAQLSHGGEVYPVKDGRVDLPAGATWYVELIKNGTLKGE